MKIDKTFEERVWGRGSGTLVCQVFSNEKPLKLTFRKRNQKLLFVNSCLG